MDMATGTGKRFLSAAALAACALAAGVAQASVIGFQCITNTSAANCATGASQLGVSVTGPSAGKVLFTFTNIGAQASSIADLYWEGGPLASMANANYSHVGQVSFSQYATPKNLPGGNSITPKFVTTPGLSAGSKAPVQPNGVNPGESLSVLFNLQPGRDYTDVLAALDAAHLNRPGGMRIGIHVQGFGNGGSESFINVPQPVHVAPVPVPASIGLLASGLAGMAGIEKRRAVEV